MRRSVFLCLALMGSWLTTIIRADETPEEPAAHGSLVILGGSERFDHREYWENIVELAGGSR